jgi:hypothetical protein
LTYTARVEHLTLMMYVGEPYKTSDPQPALWGPGVVMAPAICVAAHHRRRASTAVALLHRDISAGNILTRARRVLHLDQKNKMGRAHPHCLGDRGAAR